MNKKIRRHSGRKFTKVYKPDEEPLEEELWNDWLDWRDSMRDVGKDKTLINKNPYNNNKSRNKKIKVKTKIRVKKKTKRI